MRGFIAAAIGLALAMAIPAQAAATRIIRRPPRRWRNISRRSRAATCRASKPCSRPTPRSSSRAASKEISPIIATIISRPSSRRSGPSPSRTIRFRCGAKARLRSPPRPIPTRSYSRAAKRSNVMALRRACLSGRTANGGSSACTVLRASRRPDGGGRGKDYLARV